MPDWRLGLTRYDSLSIVDLYIKKILLNTDNLHHQITIDW